MGIFQSETNFFKSRNREQTPEDGAWLCECDQCGTVSHGAGRDAGQAADAARKDGFTTIPSKRLSAPSRWLCKECKKAYDNEELPFTD